RNLSFFFVHGKDLNLNLVTDLQNFLRMFQLAPGYLRNVKQSVDSAQVDKSAVVGKAHNCTFHDIVHVQTFPYSGNLLLLFFVEHNLVGEYSSAPSLINSRDLYIENLSDKFICVFDKLIRQLRKRNKTG